MKLQTVGYMSDPYLVQFRKNCWSMACAQPGIDVDYLNTALQLTQIEAEVIPKDYPVPQALSMIENGTADMTVHAIIQTAERMQTVDFTIPINYIVYGYLAKEIQELQTRDFVLRSVCPEVILFMIVALIFGPLLMWIFSGYHRSYDIWLLHSTRVLLKQDGEVKRRYSTANSFFMISWIWFCFFFTLYFESAMKSNLTLSSKKGYEFQDLEGLLDALDRKGWRLAIQDEIGWEFEHFCRTQHHQCDRLQKHVKGAFHFSADEDPSKNFPSKTVLLGGFHINLVQSDVVILDRKSRLLFIKDQTLQPGMLAYAINKNLSEVLQKLNTALAKMQGSYENFAGRYSHPYIPYRRIDSTSEFFELRLVYLWPLFRLCIILIAVTIGVFLFEIILEKSGLYIHLMREECRCEKKTTKRHLTRHSIIGFVFRRTREYRTNSTKTDQRLRINLDKL